MTLEFWYVLPVAVLIATTAMASGVEGATFFSPLFILALGLPPEVAIGAGLMDSAVENEGSKKAETCLTTSTGEEICYAVCNRTEGRLIAGVGGTFIGMISTGLGELNGYFLLQRCRVPSRVVVATSVLVVAVTALTASAGHVVQLAQGDPNDLGTILSLLLFTVPGVVVGGQVGSAVARHIPQRALMVGMGILFILVAALMLGEVILNVR